MSGLIVRSANDHKDTRNRDDDFLSPNTLPLTRTDERGLSPYNLSFVMVLRPLLLSFFLLAFFPLLFAQPEPCGDPPVMTSFCADACVICDIDGFTGRNDLSIRGQSVNNFCTTFNHNMSFIAFIAGTEDLSIDVTVDNCVSGTVLGLEVGIFESFDCTTFVPISDCDTDVRPNTTVRFSNNVPMVVGQHYYLMMDGSNGDICDWTFDVVEGSTAVGVLTTSGVVSGIEETCPDLPTRFVTMGTEAGAALFHWRVDGDLAATTNSAAADLTFPADGAYEVCVTAGNVCDEAPPSCTTVNVRTVGTLTIDTFICRGDAFLVADTMLTTPGGFDFTIILANGCDSLIAVTLALRDQASESIDINLCVGEEFFIGNTPYSTTGVFVDTILTVAACDSIVTLDLFMIECEIRGSTDFVQPECRGEANGQLFFSVENGTPPFSYDWANILDESIGGSGSTVLFDDNVIEGVPAGRYEVNVRDNFGNDVVFFQDVTEPEELSVAATAGNIDGFNLNCSGGSDGRIAAIGEGGAFPYTFTWSSQQNGPLASALAAGVYTVSLTDANGCVRTAMAEILPPPLLAPGFVFTDPNCDGLETGSAEVATINGGTAPFLISLNGGAFDTLRRLDDLSPGMYSLKVRDDNGCVTDSSSSLTAPGIPIIFPWGHTSTQLGCEVSIPTRINNVSVASISWLNPLGTLDCDTCLSPNALPLNSTQYVLTVTSEDNCSTTDSLTVLVEKHRKVYAPTAFSPNGDGVNDAFILGLGKAAVSVRSLRIYDRWGGLVYEGTDLVPNEPGSGWDGQVGGEPAGPGHYAWTSEIIYLDGVELSLRGGVMLLK
jgi:gliding motility-associated-like protein